MTHTGSTLELSLRKFVAPEFIFGSGARNLAGQYAKNLGARKVFVVSDKGVMAAGWTQSVTDSLEASSLPYTVYTNVTPNPRTEEVMKGAELYKREECNVIIAVGGGSPMDCAKGIGIVNANEQHITQFEGVDEVTQPAPPLICIPTTAGSAADVSQFAIISNRQRDVKIAIISKMVVPDVALIDPETTLTMDTALTAATGIDALVHAIEAYVSNAASPITDLHAEQAIQLVTQNLLPAIKAPQDMQFRGRMMLASLHAGLAFSNASLGMVHAMAHSLGGFLDTPHGESNALLLAHVINFNFIAAPGRYRRVAELMGIAISGHTFEEQRAIFVEGILKFCNAAGINYRLSDLGVKTTDISELARKAMQDACMATNPRRPTQKDVEVVFEKAM